MHKSEHVLNHQYKLASWKKWRCLGMKKYRKIIHNFKKFDMLRFPRRIARWRAMILQSGGRYEHI